MGVFNITKFKTRLDCSIQCYSFVEKSDNFIIGRSICTVNSHDNNNETLRGSEDPELDAAPALTVEKEER